LSIHTSAVLDPPTTLDPKNVFSVDEVAARMRVSKRVIYGLTRQRCSNPIPHFRVGKRLRFNWLAVSAWAEHQYFFRSTNPNEE